MTIKDAKTIFLYGIAGTGMRGLASLLAAAGKDVSGTDEIFAGAAAWPAEENITLCRQSDTPRYVSRADVLICTDAIGAAHPIQKLAQNLRVPLLFYHQALAQLAEQYDTIAVAGTHGKSSTTVFLAHILIAAGFDPTVLVGASVPDWQGKNARAGRSRLMVVEADEYRDHFLALRPSAAIITTIDFDHPDFFSSLAAVEQSFATFIDRLPNPKRLVTSTPTHNAHHLRWPDTTITVDPTTITPLHVPIPGRHMQLNAALAVAMGEHLGVPPELARQSLAQLSGIGRRFERLGDIAGLEIVSDYGHHPQEIRATLTAARQWLPPKKIVALFEAHTPERLATFTADFARALALADAVIICPVFAPSGRGRRQIDQALLLASLARAVRQRTVVLAQVRSYRELSSLLRRQASSYDMAIAFSAGVLDSELRKLLRHNQSGTPQAN